MYDRHVQTILCSVYLYVHACVFLWSFKVCTSSITKMFTNTHTHKRTNTHTRTHTHIYTYTHIHIHTYTQTHTHTHAYIHLILSLELFFICMYRFSCQGWISDICLFVIIMYMKKTKVSKTKKGTSLCVAVYVWQSVWQSTSTVMFYVQLQLCI